jgi:WD40 repeat protein
MVVGYRRRPKNSETVLQMLYIAAIREIAISRDGTMLVSGGDDNTLILWNLQRILNVDALAYGCALVQDYLKTNTAVEEARFIYTS